MKRQYQTAVGIALIGVLLLFSAGCETKAGTGALVGGAGGAAVGGAIGSFSHSRAGEGALIGGAIGALGGAIVGNEMDKQDREKAADHSTRRERERRYDAVTKGDIIAWTKNGVKDDVIIDRIERSGTIFRLHAGDENDLRDAGVSEDVVRAMKDTARR